jgi:hypothetical protein
MTWFKVDDSFHSHLKVLAAEPAALGLWVVAGSWCGANLTDGFIPDHVLPRLIPSSTPLALQLVDCGLWRRTKGGYQVLRHVPAAPGGKPLELWAIERDDYRRKIPDHIRAAVFERDEFTCVECGAMDDLTLDHIHPWSLGGPDTAENLRVLCRQCNSRKGARV